MAKSVYIVGTADTKLEELLWLKSCLLAAKVPCYIIDASTGQNSAIDHNDRADIQSVQLAAYHPNGADAVFCTERGAAIAAMSAALTHFLQHNLGDIAGIIGIGGSGGTALITTALKTMPIGMPKIMVSTMASGNVEGYVGGMDIAMLYAVTDLCGLNHVTRKILANAAGMMAGAVGRVQDSDEQQKAVLGLTMFGVTTPCVNQLVAALSDRYEPLVFHATGSGGASMEKLVEEGEMVGVLDVTLTEIADLLFGGTLACSDNRLDVIAKTQTPWVGSAGALDMVNFGARSSVPERYAHRQFIEHNAQVTLMRTTPEENYQLGVWIGNKLNHCDGLICFIVPEGGYSALDDVGQPFNDPQARQAFAEGLETTLVQTARRQIIKTPHHINSPEFSALALAQFHDLMRRHEAERYATPGKSI